MELNGKAILQSGKRAVLFAAILVTQASWAENAVTDGDRATAAGNAADLSRAQSQYDTKKAQYWKEKADNYEENAKNLPDSENDGRKQLQQEAKVAREFQKYYEMDAKNAQQAALSNQTLKNYLKYEGFLSNGKIPVGDKTLGVPWGERVNYINSQPDGMTSAELANTRVLEGSPGNWTNARDYANTANGFNSWGDASSGGGNPVSYVPGANQSPGTFTDSSGILTQAQMQTQMAQMRQSLIATTPVANPAPVTQGPYFYPQPSAGQIVSGGGGGDGHNHPH